MATVTAIDIGHCCWAMTDRDGYQYPCGADARRRVEGAGELLDGEYCVRHARMAMDWAARGIEPDV